MTANRQGITISTKTLRWLELAVVLVALVGPLTGWLATVNSYGRDIHELQKGHASHGARMDKFEDRLDANGHRIDARLQSIEATVNRIAGKLEANHK
jgi:hypothetical protein